MKNFDIDGMTPAQFIEKLKGSLVGRKLGEMVDFKLVEDKLSIVISKLGTSEIVYKLEKAANGFKATLQQEKIAFAHKFGKAEIEDKLKKLLSAIGAKLG